MHHWSASVFSNTHPKPAVSYDCGTRPYVCGMWLLLLIHLSQTPAVSQTSTDADPPESKREAESAPATAEETPNTERTTLNLLGEVDTKSGEARRNENVRMTLIDNNVLKELNQRMGTTATVIKEFRVEQRYFGSEFGSQPVKGLHLAPPAARTRHGQLYWRHDNSVFSARSFFQVGKVKPALSHDYGFTFSSLLWKDAFLTVNANQRKLRGQVNGNVLVPAPDERTPLTQDPATRAIVESILGAYPDELPNRQDINPRALNTNGAQNIDNDRVGLILDQAFGQRDHLTASYNLTIQKVEAFQLVGGQNPDTTTRNHRAALSWNRAWTPKTTTQLSVGFDRVGSLLVPEETSLGTFYHISRVLQSVGPGGNIPIDRAQNTFRYAGRVQQVRGAHKWTLGFELARRQINGSESNEHRGVFGFARDFGRDTITNLRWGAPTLYIVTIGDAHRGFRNWGMQYFLGDVWQVRPNLTLNLGLRYEPVTRPSEVNGLSRIPYGCDCNNFAPQFGFAYRMGSKWGVLRAGYGMHYGEIFPATFMQARFNPPENLSLFVGAPDLVDPLKDFSPEDLDPDARASVFQLSSRLVAPYVHHYNLEWELGLSENWILELGYVGSRSRNLLVGLSKNRAQPVPGIPQTTRTINQRRADPRYFDVVDIANGSRGYFDAAKVTLRIRSWGDLSLDTSYWFSKAIDLGADYTNTASGRDQRKTQSPSEFGFTGDMKAVSEFDQPHALLWRINYLVPRPALRSPMINGWLQSIAQDWQLSSIILLKSGTPFSLQAGSDSPGFGNVDGALGDRPNLLDPSILGRSIDHPDTSQNGLPRDAFSFMAPTDPRANLGRNIFRKDGVFNVNLSLSRRFSLGGDRWLQFRAESLNLLNHPQFAEPGVALSSPNFGQITNTLNDGRTFQFMLSLGF